MKCSKCGEECRENQAFHKFPLDLDYLEDEQYVTKNYIPREKRMSQTGGTRRLAEPSVTQTDFLVDGTGFSEQTPKSSKNSKHQPNRQEDIKREKKIFKIKTEHFARI